MKRYLALVALAVVQLGLVGVAVAPQLSARVTGDTYIMRVTPVDPIEPGRGRYVQLHYPDLQVGDYTIVHAGFAITRLDEKSANETLQMFHDLGILEEELGTA